MTALPETSGTGTQVVSVAYGTTDEAADGVALGRVLADILDMPLEVLRVMTEPAERHPAGQRASVQRERHAKQAVIAALQGFEGDLVTVTDRSVATALTRATRDPDLGLLVLGSTHRGRLGRLIFGLGAEYVVPHAECPVAVAPPGFRGRARLDPAVVGVAYDGTETAERALELGIRMAQQGGLALRIVSVRPRGLQAVAHATLHSVDAEHLERLAGRIAADHPELAVELDHPTGDPVGSLAERTEGAIGLLLAGAHRHAGPRRALIGTVAIGLIRRAHAPVMIVP